MADCLTAWELGRQGERKQTAAVCERQMELLIFSEIRELPSEH